MRKPKSPYKYVEYLESTGVQYIDTGISHYQVYGFEIEYQSRGIVQQNKQYNFDGVFGVNGLGTNGDIKLWFNYGNKDAILNNIYCQTPVFRSSSMNLEEQYATKNTVAIKNKVVKFNGEQIGTITEYGKPTKGVSIHMFGVNNTGTSSLYRSATRIYVLKLYDENDNIIGYLNPAFVLKTINQECTIWFQNSFL